MSELWHVLMFVVVVVVISPAIVHVRVHGPGSWGWHTRHGIGRVARREVGCWRHTTFMTFAPGKKL